MDKFLADMAPHLAANLLTVAILYGFFRRASQEKRGIDDDDAFLTLGSILLGMGFLAAGMYFYGAFS